jgi:hypothetical protein
MGRRVALVRLLGLEERSYYHLAYSDSTFFNDPSDVELDVSDSPTWQSLIGAEVVVSYRGAGQQIVQARSKDAAVYCGSFQCDRVFVTQEAPD